MEALPDSHDVEDTVTAPTTWSPDAKAALARLDGRLFATVTEVSAILSYDPQGRTVRRAIAAGEIPAIRAGSTWRVPTAWIRAQVGLGTDSRATARACPASRLSW
jgi:excisionase family DNA binding protein